MNLTFRLPPSPGGLVGSIILRYSSFESLCSDFSSRSVAWSWQAASCAYSCLWTRKQRSRAHQKGGMKDSSCMGGLGPPPLGSSHLENNVSSTRRVSAGTALACQQQVLPCWSGERGVNRVGEESQREVPLRSHSPPISLCQSND